MPNLSQRSKDKELLDSDNIPFADIRQNMQELDVVNRLLGGHRVSLKGIKYLAMGTNEPLRILEIGSGGGDNLTAIQSWADHTNRSVSLTGVDINPHCITYASQKITSAQFILSDFREYTPVTKPHIIIAALFAHHLADEEIVQMLRWMHDHCEVGFMINDLHRHPLAYHSIRLLTRIFSNSYLVKNDAPLSVAKGFNRKDWKRLFEKAGITFTSVTWQWAFRWLVLHKKS